MKDIKVYKMDYINDDEICEAMNVNSILNDFTFIYDLGDGHFHFLPTSENYLTELHEDMEWHTNKFEDDYVRRLKNEIKLVEYLRSKGYTDGIHVYVDY